MVDIEGEAPPRVFLRIPDWCTNATVRLNGEAASETPVPGRYLEMRRSWSPGDRVELDLAMPPELVTSDERVRDHAGCIAVRRGPLIYCLEGPDNPDVSVLAARIHIGPQAYAGGLQATHRDDLLEGVTVIEADGSFVPGSEDDGPLYSILRGRIPLAAKARLTFIPYYAWANRGPSKMTVWVPMG